MRAQTSCTLCRNSKRKYITPDEHKACERCARLRLECSISSNPKRTLEPSAIDLTPKFDPIDCFSSQELCNDLVDLHFDLFHDKQHALFHRPSFLVRQREGLAPRVLVAAITALAARFSSDPFFAKSDSWTRGHVWAACAKVLFDNRQEPVSLTGIQACCLLSIIAFTDGDMQTESLYGALAIRMVQLLDLPKQLSPSRLDREIEVRVVWNIWMMDNWTSVGARLPRQITLPQTFPKPMEEFAFEKLAPDMDFSPVNTEEWHLHECGLWAQMIPLTEVIAPINELHEFTVSAELSTTEISSRVERIGNKLDSWLLRLPPHLHATQANLEGHAVQGHSRTLVALHLGFHYHSQLLYYQFLQPARYGHDQSLLSRTYAERCKGHALTVSNLLWQARSLPGCDCKWGIVGHLLVVANSIILSTLLHSTDQQEILIAKETLTHNFEMMMELRRYWPSIDLSMSRLRSFHRALNDGIEAHGMDYWMLNFFQRYMAPVRDRIPSESEDMATWPSELGIIDDFDNIEHVFDDSGETIGSRILNTFL